jgi:hypothetical protein
VQIFASTAQTNLPVATTVAPTYNGAGFIVAINGAISTLNCGQTAGNSAATVSFQYGISNAYVRPGTVIPYTTTVPAVPSTVPAGVTPQPVTAAVLVTCDMSISYRVVTTNSAGTTYGAWETVNVLDVCV